MQGIQNSKNGAEDGSTARDRVFVDKNQAETHGEIDRHELTVPKWIFYPLFLLQRC